MEEKIRMVNQIDENLLKQLADKAKIKPENIAYVLKLGDEYALTYGESVYVIKGDSVEEYLAYEPNGAFYLTNGDIVYERQKFDTDNWEENY